MHIKEIGAGAECDLLYEIKIPTFTDVDDALNHDRSRTRSCPIQLREVEMDGAGRRCRRDACSDSEETTGDSSALEHPASLPLGGSTPHAVVDSIVEGVIEALSGDRAGGKNALCHLNADPIAGEEGGGGMVFTVAVINPWGGGFHVRETNDGG